MAEDRTSDEAGSDRAEGSRSADRADEPLAEETAGRSDDGDGGDSAGRGAERRTGDPLEDTGHPPEGTEADPGEAPTGTTGQGPATGPRRDDEGPAAPDAEATDASADPGGRGADRTEDDDVPADVRSYDRFQKVDRATYDRVNEFLRDRTYVTAREWAIARLCADFRTATGVEMTKVGENLPHLVPFMTDTYTPQAVNQARSAFEEKVRMAGATFLYGAMSGFFTADELDDLMYEVTEVAKFLLEVEGVELTVDEELDAEDRISAVMREVRQASEELRYDEVACPHCGQAFQPDVED